MGSEWDGQERRENTPLWVKELIQEIQQTKNGRDNLSRSDRWLNVFEIASRIILAGVVALLTWVVVQIYDIKGHLLVIESTRFSSVDWQKARREIDKDLNKKSDIDKTPPQWLRNEVNQLRQDVNRLDGKQ